MRPAAVLRQGVDATHARVIDRHSQRLASELGVSDPIEDAHQLSPVQEAMLFHAVGSSADDIYIVQQRLEIDGPLDVDRFQRAWDHVIGRHTALRSVFAWDHHGPPLQLVCRSVTLPIELMDLTTADDAESVIEDLFEADRRHRFDLASPPLMRIKLFRTRHDRHVMLWSQHHLLQDGWSSSVVLREVFAAYEALGAGHAPDLEAARPFRHYIEWLEANRREDEQGFWRQHLAGFRQPTRMAKTDGTGRPSAYTRLFHSLTAELTTELRAFARSCRVSLNTVLTGALAIVLSRYVGRPDVAFGTVAAGRPPTLSGVESMVGMFINTLVLRIEVDQAARVGEWLATVQTRQASLFDHEHSSLPDVQRVSELRAGVTLTDVLFAYWNFGGAGSSPDGSVAYRTVDGYGRTSFPFSITVEGSDPINLGVDFDAAEVDPTTAQRFLEHFGNVLAAMVADPDAPVGSLDMLTSSESADLDRFNDSSFSIPHATVLDAFAAQVNADPRAVAAECEGRSMTYAELDAASDDLARRLLALTAPKPPRVAIYLERSLEMIVALWAVLKAGGAYVPVDRHLPQGRVSLLVAESDADVVVTAPDLTDLVAATPAQPVAYSLDEAPGDLPQIELPAVDPDALAYVMFTSGSTGRPKGVMIRHRSLVNYVWWAAQEYGGGSATDFPLYSSFAFDLTVTSMFVPLVTGGRIVVYPDRDRRDLAIVDVFRDDAVDVVKLTPSHLAVLEPEQLAPTRIRRLILGGEDLKVGLAAAVHEAAGAGLAIYNEYGPTETTVGCMIHRFDPETDMAGSVPIGRPAGNVTIHLLDGALAPVPLGAIGEIYVGGPGVAAGYLNRPDLTAERFVADPSRPGEVLYRTGDLAQFDTRGLLTYLGRTDEQIKVRGHRLEPGEIEAVLVTHPAVAEAAVAIREPRPGDVRLVAYFVAADGVAANVTDLRTHLQEHLPAYMVPPHFVRIDALPLTTNGKLDRDALPHQLGETVSTAAHVAPRNEAEALVAETAAELLGVADVSLGDNFFDVGGHSILAMQLIARLHLETGVRVSPRIVLLNTLEQVAAQLPAGAELANEIGPSQREVAENAMGTSAFFFGPSDGPLFGVRHTPSGDRVRDHGVVVCAPVGWEYMRTHRALRGLGRRLGLDGFSVLRFDFFGTGDSLGDEGEATFARWEADIASAVGELTAGGSGRVTIVGMRLGASIAVAAASNGLDVDRLVLWDPIVRGADHLADLERMHAEMLGNRPGVPAATLGDELLGFRYPLALRAALVELDLTAGRWPDADVVIVASQPSAALADLAEQRGARLDVVADAGAWDDLSSAQAALLPTAIPAHIMRLLREDA